MTAAAYALTVQYMPLDELLERHAPRNPKDHDLPGIRSSIARFGFVDPALLDERTGRIVAGHGRSLALASMRGAGEDPPAGVQVDDDGRWLIAVNRGWSSRSDREAEAYLLADNRLTEKGGWHEGELLESLRAIAEDLDGTGFTQQDLAALDALAEPVPNLNDLANKHGAGDGDDDPTGDPTFQPKINLSLSVDTFERWRLALDYHLGDSDVDKLVRLLGEVEACRELHDRDPA